MAKTHAHQKNEKHKHKQVLEHFTSPKLSIEERFLKGRMLREKVSLESHAQYHPSKKRKDPVSILEKQAESRIQVLVPVRHARMLASPFAFLRGAAAIMAGDLATTPVSGINVQICGDMHVANFGVFASAERNLLFGINDFDETINGPWEWDLKRLAASAVVAGRFLGADKNLCEESAREVVRSYRKRIRQYAEMGLLDVWYARIGEQDVLDSLGNSAKEGALKIMAKARQRGHAQVLNKLTEIVDNNHQIIESAPLIVRETHTEAGMPISKAIGHTLSLYLDSLPEDRQQLLKQYRVVDVARKVVGVGSVGTRCWIVLLRGNSADDPLFLQYKEAQQSVLAPYLSTPKWDFEGRRVVVGQRMIQSAPDIFLGWGFHKDIRSHFYLRQLRDMKGGVEFDPQKTKVKNMPEYAKLCGWALALAHAKAGDAAMIAGYLGKSDAMDIAVAQFANSYADQTERDHAAMVVAAKKKRIKVAKT